MEGIPGSVSVVVACRDRHELLRDCLGSVRRNRHAAREIIVVDSASRHPERTEKVARDAGARFLRVDIPGAGIARNIGARAARGDLIAFTDDDAIVDEGWLGALVDAFGDPSACAVVGPVFVKGILPARAMRPRAGFDPARERMRISRQSAGWFDELALGSIGFGANLGVRRAAFDRFGYFANGLGAGAPISGDENYFFLTLVAQGGIVVSEPRARVFHPPQSEARIREIARTAIAYLLYVAATRPGLIAPLAIRMARRAALGSRRTHDASVAGPAHAGNSLWRSALAAPGALWAAWRIERRLSVAPTIEAA